MPTYQYLCTKCGHEFERFQSIAAKALTVCPEDLCARKPWGKGRVKRLISAGAGLLFKGSGFYITDYRNKEYRDKERKEAPEATSGTTDGAKTNGPSPESPKPESKGSSGAQRGAKRKQGSPGPD